jgi:hypothetical protein
MISNGLVSDCPIPTYIYDVFDASSCHIKAQMCPTYYNLFECLCREEHACPKVWSHICVQKLAKLAKESTTM